MTPFHHNHKPRRVKPTTKPPQSPPTSPAILKCPRCDSINTKFCYYNNYSLSQPRHYCKNCRRYWTRGGALRNVPIGGSTRNKNKNKPPCSNVMTSLSSSSHDVIDGFRLINPPSTNYMFPLNANYNVVPSSSTTNIESLNQQQRLMITSMLLQDSLPVNDKLVMFQNVDLIPPPSTGTDWMFDRSSTAGGGGATTSGRNENNRDYEGSLGLWYP